MLNKNVIDSLLDSALRAGGDFAEVFEEDASHSSILAYKDRIETSSFGRETGVGLRIFEGLNSIYGYTTDKSADNLFRLVDKMTSTLKETPRDRQPLQDLCTYGEDYPIKISPTSVPYTGKLEVMQHAIDAGLKFSPLIVQMAVKYVDMEQRIQVANTEGVYAQDTRTKTRLHITAYAQHNNVIQNSYMGPAAMQGFEFYETLDIGAFAQEAARMAVTMAKARKCPGGQMPIVIDNGRGGLLFHEACGHSLEANSVAKGTSEFSGMLGQQIASPLVTLIDDGTIPNQWGSLAMDDEGTPTRNNVLIENGVLRNYMIDKLNARRMGMPGTGSGRRQNFRFAPVARMTNTYIANGTSTRDEIIANTEKGLFVKYINGGSVNAATGDFNFNTSECYLIEQGRITEPVRGATLIGNGSKVLKQVDMVGNNLELAQTFCFSASGALFVGVGQPTVRVSNMTVGGV